MPVIKKVVTILSNLATTFRSYKYLAALQATIGRQKKVTNPIVIQHITSKASHGMPERMSIEDASNIYTFIAKYTNAIWVK